MNEYLKQISDEIDTGGRQNLYNSLQKLAKIQREQYQSSLTDPSNVRKILGSIEQSIQKNKSQIEDTQIFQNKFKQFLAKLPAQKIQENKGQINHIVRRLNKFVEQKQMIQQKQDQIAKQIKQKFQQSLTQKDNFTLQNSNPLVLEQQPNNTTIQQSLIPYSSLFQSGVPAQVSLQNAPTSVRYLAQYTKNLGYNPIGPITGSYGRCFIGTKQYTQGDGTVTLSFPQNNIQYPNVPDIPVKIQYFANKTINSWNRFVADQSKMINFFNKINGGPQSRVKYIENSLVYLNLQNFAAQTLATLTYYYFYLPLLRYSKISNIFGITQNNFFDNYSPAQKTSQNPLLLKTDTCIKLAKALINVDDNKTSKRQLPTQTYTRIYDSIIKPNQNQINKHGFTKLKQYQLNRNSQAQTYFKTSGIPKQRYQGILSNKKFKVKTKKFIFNDQFRNNQLVQIINRVTQKQKIGITQQDLWDLQWGSKQIYAWDYIYRK